MGCRRTPGNEHFSQKIVQYILQQVPPPYRGYPIPRLSLYLSAQLSYGVVCVYHRQCDLLLEEVKITIKRLCKAGNQAKIDLVHTNQRLLLPDNLMLMQMLEYAPMPFFGKMEISPELPDPLMIPQFSMLLETSGPEIVRLEKTAPKHRRRTSHREDISHMASPETITIKEVEPAPLPSVEFGQDLPEVSAQDWELLESELPSLPAIETLPEPRRRRIPGESEKREHPKDAKELSPKKPKTTDTIRDIETEEQHVEDTEIEVDRARRELHDMEKEIERLKEEKQQIEIQRELERERERNKELDREKKYQEKLRRETAHLQKAIQELKHLQSVGAAEELLLKKQEEIKHLKKIQKEKERQWEIEQLKLLLRAQEREREYLEEIENLKQRLREAEKETERLKMIIAEKERAEKGMEPDKKTRKKEARDDEKRKSETEGSPVRSSPKSGLPSEMLSELDAAALLDEVTGQPIDLFPEGALAIQSPVPAPPPVSPQPLSPQLMLPEVPLEAKHLPPIRRAVRRTSLIVDNNTQIERKVMQEQTSNPLINTQPRVPVKIPDMKSRTAATLLESPTYQNFMAPELRELWSRCAFLEPLQYIHEREEEAISELEEMRALTESGASLMLSSEVSLEVSEEERSRPILLTPEDRRALAVQEDVFLPMVSEMPETIVKLPEAEVLLSDLQRMLFSEIDSAGQSEFLSLTPRSLPRLLVSRFFSSCLELCTQEVIRLEQTEPYGPIIITPGRLYSQK